MKRDNNSLYTDKFVFKDLLKLPVYFWNGIKYHTTDRLFTPKPLTANITLTHRCNSRCITCDRWKNHSPTELEPDQITQIFRNPLFSSINNLSLSGGEAALREDLGEIAQRAVKFLPKLREITLFTNGLEPELITEQVKILLQIARFKEICGVNVYVSVDGINTIHDKIHGIQGAFERVSETINRLQQLQKLVTFNLSARCTVQPLNMYDLLPILNFSRHIALPLSFAPLKTSNVFINDREENEFLTFTMAQYRDLNNIFVRDIFPYLTTSNRMFWKDLFLNIGGDERKMPCHMLRYYVNLETDGALRLCDANNSLVLGSCLEVRPDKLWYSGNARKLRKKVKTTYCRKCTIAEYEAFSLSREFFYFACNFRKK
jgi:MoaA/NifB/PqqE/SkfB family radical SAM enzyme